MTRPLIALAVVFVLAGTSSAWAQRDVSAPTGGTGVIRGRVVAADTVAPVRDVTLSLRPADTPPAVRSTGAVEILNPLTSPVTRADDGGRFEFIGVSAGRYRIAAEPGPTAARYLPVRYPDPAAEDSGPLTVGAGQVIEQVEIALPRSAVITGRVVDDRGNPMALVTIIAQESLPGDRRRPAQGFWAGVSTTRTDDTGSFRIFGLRPGEYVVMAQPLRLASSGIEPATLAIGMMTPAYYPGTLSPTEAARIRLGWGDEYGPVEFTLSAMRSLTIRGVVLDPSGQPVPSVNVSLRSVSATASIPVSGGHSRATKADGTFELAGVPPGEYAISIHRSGPQGSQFAWLPVTVADDVEGLAIRLQPGVTVKGHVVFEGQAPAKLPTMYVRSIPGRSGGMNAYGVMPAADLSFTLEQQFGPTLIRSDGPPGWHLKSVLHGGRDITDDAVEFAPGGPPLQVLLTQNAASLTGIVTTAAGVPTEASVVLLSEDPALWHERATTTRITATSANGKYRLEGMRPGRYLITATTREESPAGLSAAYGLTAAYLELLAKSATPVVIGEAESKSVDLKRIAIR